MGVQAPYWAHWSLLKIKIKNKSPRLYGTWLRAGVSVRVATWLSSGASWRWRPLEVCRDRLPAAAETLESREPTPLWLPGTAASAPLNRGDSLPQWGRLGWDIWTSRHQERSASHSPCLLVFCAWSKPAEERRLSTICPSGSLGIRREPHESRTGRARCRPGQSWVVGRGPRARLGFPPTPRRGARGPAAAFAGCEKRKGRHGSNSVVGVGSSAVTGHSGPRDGCGCTALPVPQRSPECALKKWRKPRERGFKSYQLLVSYLVYLFIYF